MARACNKWPGLGKRQVGKQERRCIMIKQLINKLKIDYMLTYMTYNVHKTGDKIADNVIWKAMLHITYKHLTRRIVSTDVQEHKIHGVQKTGTSFVF